MSSVIDDRPNILIIVADDLGFTDPGCFGGEINTPAIDKLGYSGVRFSDFQASPACSPSRSMLMTGTSAHLAGVGTLPEFHQGKYKMKCYENDKHYLGHLTDEVVTMPEILRDAGYYTCMAGKWHLGKTKEHSPKARGFEKSWSLLVGGGNHYAWEPTLLPEDEKYKPMIRGSTDGMYMEEDEFFTSFPDDYYSSDYFTDRLLGYLKDRPAHDKRPFFAYLPFQAPHFPLQAPRQNIDHYCGRYEAGPEVLRAERIERLREMGFISPDAKPAPFHTYPRRKANRPWEQREEPARRRSARKMEVYAGMVERMDWNIGRVLDHLESTGQRDNTAIFFLSDNGAEGTILEATPANRSTIPGYRKYYDNSLENLGDKTSYCWYGNRWAQVGTAPSKLYKFFTHQGGIRVCSLVSYPPWQKHSGAVSHEYCTIMDILPTVLDLAGARHPGSKWRGRPVQEMTGRSWGTYLRGEEEHIHPRDVITGWEFIGRMALRKGDLKIVKAQPPWGSGQWEMYNLKSDLAEDVDLRHVEPDKFNEMLAHWEEYAKKNGIKEMPEFEKFFTLQEENLSDGELEDLTY